MIAVVGLGPAGAEHLTTRTLELVDDADVVFLRTLRHPAAVAVLERRADVMGFDDVYEAGGRIEEVYADIVSRLVDEAAAGRSVCYAVPGSPTVAERTVALLRAEAPARGIVLAVEPAVSYLDLAWDRLGIDPVAAGVRLADAAEFAVAAAGAPATGGPYLLAQAWSRQILSDVKLALDHPAPDQRAVICHHLGLPDERVEEVAWADLDRSFEPDHLTSLYIPSLATPPAAAVAAFAATVASLRQLCPWDREQTHRSLVRHLLEETYEAIEALEALGDTPEDAPAETVAHAEEELGDLLCQVVFHATIGAEEGLFTLSDIAETIDQKLITRHPHVFSSAHAETADDVIRNWERSKDETKKRSHLLDGIPAAMPALARAEKVERKLRSVGLGWDRSASGSAPGSGSDADSASGSAPGPGPDAGTAAGDLADRLAAVLGADGGPREEEAGDLLLHLARWCADRGLDPEAAVRHALDRLGDRVRAVEAEAAAAGLPLADWVESLPVHEQHLPL